MFTLTTIGIIVVMILIAFLVFLNVAFDDASKYPAMNKLVHRIDIIVILVAVAAIVKFNLWC